VGRVDPANLGRVSTLFYHLAGGTYAELFEAWIVTEPILAERAARNEDRAAVKAAMAPFSRPPPAGQDPDGELLDFVESHVNFHAVVAKLAENRVLELMLESIGQIVTHHVVVNADPRDLQDDIDRDHLQLARAIAAGQANRARTLMADHIERMVDHYRSEIGDQMHDFIEWR